MGLPNINITISLFKDIKDIKNIKSFSMPFDTIVAKTENNKKYIDDFFIVLNVNLLAANNYEKGKMNIVNQKGKLNILIRLAKVSNNIKKQIFMDLGKLEIDLSDKSNVISHACVDYLVYRAILSIPKITLSPVGGLGEYVIKALIKPSTSLDDVYTVQSLVPLRIE